MWTMYGTSVKWGFVLIMIDCYDCLKIKKITSGTLKNISALFVIIGSSSLCTYTQLLAGQHTAKGNNHIHVCFHYHR